MNDATTPLDVSLIVEPYQSGLRVDAVLAQYLRNYDIWTFQRLVRWGAVTVNHQPANLLRRLHSGDLIQVRLIEPPDLRYEPQEYPLSVIYEDQWIICINKSPGVIAHPTGNRQSGTLCNYLQAYFDQQSVLTGLIRPGIVHRLDRETTGAIVIAKTHLAHRNLVDAFENSRVSKKYLAIVQGIIKEEKGTINLPIGQARTGSRVLMSTAGDALRKKEARTSWKVIRRIGENSTDEGFTVVTAQPKTGRNHQIRVHFAAIGHPLLADQYYLKAGRFNPVQKSVESQKQSENAPRCERTGLSRHALHACELELAHPITGVWLHFKAGIPADILQAIIKLEQKNGAQE